MADLSSPDLYARLGLSKTATDAAIKKAYRSLALKHHPDKGGDPESFKALAEAYAVLSTPDKKRLYDATGEASLVDLDVEGMMAEVFEEGGWFAQQVADDPEMRAMMEEEGMENMQKSFGSFFAAAMGGGGKVYLPDGTEVDAPKIKMPSLADLIKDSTDDEERELMLRVQKKMGIGERGALVPGTGMQALNLLQSLGNDPSFWSDGSGSDEDEDAFLDELKAELSAKKKGKGSASSSGDDGGGGRDRRGGGGGGSSKQASVGWPAAPPARTSGSTVASGVDGGLVSSGGGGDGIGDGDEGEGEGEDDESVTAACTADASTGKAWLDAARNGLAKELSSLLSEEPTLVHYRGVGLGQTALHWAATKGHAPIVTWLIHRKAPIGAKNANGARPLHAAAAAGETECAQLLVAAGASVSARDDDGKSCVALARERGHRELAELLSRGGLRRGDGGGSNGAGAGGPKRGGGGGGGGGGDGGVPQVVRSSCQVRMPSGMSSGSSGSAEHTPRLHAAQRATADRAAADVSDHAADGDESSHTDDEIADPVRDAASRGESGALVAALADFDQLRGLGGEAARRQAVNAADEAGLAPLHLACRVGSAACVKALLEARADGGAHSAKGNSPLAVAAKHSQWESARALLEGGVRADGLALLHALRRQATTEMAELMVRSGGLGGDDASNGRSALMAAAAAGDPSSLLRLIKLGADVRLADGNGATPLHYCADKGDFRCAVLLIEHGASLEATDQHGNTPLHAAGRCAHAKLYETLLASGADPSALNDRGRPPKLLDEADGGCLVM